MFIIGLCLSNDIIFEMSKPPEFFIEAIARTEFC